MNLMKHIEKAEAAYKNGFGAVDKWRDEKEEAHKKVYAQADKMTREGAVELHAAHTKEFADKLETIREEMNNGVSAAREAYRKEIEDFYRPNGADIDANDKAVLDSGILNVKDYEDMILKYAEVGNVTMLKIIEKSVKDSGVEVADELKIALRKATKDGKKFFEIFKAFEQLMNAVFGMGASDSVSKETFLNAAVNAEEYKEDAKKKILEAKIYLNEEEIAELEKMETKDCEVLG